jgi:ribonucleoside-diphosphate reductase alpha chain
MDYIFRWLNLRFLSGTQLSLFAGFGSPAPQLPASPSLIPDSETDENEPASQGHLARLAEEVAKRLNMVGSQTGGFASGGGIAPEAVPTQSSIPSLNPEKGTAAGAPAAYGINLKDRGIYHASDAMREMYEMGDAPSCSTCGAIMVRNGSCYRCMSCGSTSGCS